MYPFIAQLLNAHCDPKNMEAASWQGSFLLRVFFQTFLDTMRMSIFRRYQNTNIIKHKLNVRVSVPVILRYNLSFQGERNINHTE